MNLSKFLAGISLSVACLSTPQLAHAIPAIPTPVTMTMPDGTSITVTIHGDENFHYYTSTDGHLLVADAQGRLCYATLAGGRLASSGVEAHDPAMRTAAELTFLNSLTPDKASRLRQAASQRLNQAREPLSSGQFTDLFTAYPSIGSPRALVLLVEFPDQKFITPQPLEMFTRLMTESGFSHEGATGSATDYFTENSRGLFTPRFDVYGPVTLPNDMAFYGRESSTLHDVNPYQMIADACKLIDGEVDFSLYDEDADGMVDNVFVFYAGYGQNSGAPSHTIWPHAANIWTYGGIKLVLDGVQVGNYACTNEIQGTSGSVLTGIGTFCHEFSHVLGLPDLYATDGTASFTPGHFELMDVGPYLNNGHTPPYMSIYDRAALRWINPRELTTGESVVLKSFDDVDSEADDEALLVTTISDNEYYLLENRQQSGWDSHIPAHGMLVWHIDYDPQLWKDNRVNSISSSQHLRVDIVEADGLADNYSWGGDPFPGNGNVTEFTDNTNPSMRTWSNIRVEKPITNIHEQDGVVSFNIMGGGQRIAPVESLPATAVGPLSFEANWTGRPEIYSYEIDLFRGEEVIPLQSVTKQTSSVTDCHLTIDGLTPETTYSYVVRAVNGDKKSANSDRVRVTTTPPTFDMLRVASLPPTDVTRNSFTARWEAMDQASSYTLDVYTKRFDEPTTDNCDFTSGLAALPEGWYTNSTATSGMAGTFGAARPSLRMSAANDLLRTPVYEVDINGITFWAKAAASSAGRLTLSGLIDGSWTPIATYDVASLAAEGRTISVDATTETAMPAGCRCLQLTFDRTAGSLFVDDVTVAYNGATSMQYLPGLQAKEMGLALSHPVTGLDNGATYYYCVKATSAEGVSSLPSAEIEVKTGTSALGRIDAEADGVTLRTAGNAIVLVNRTTTDKPYRVYTVDGRTVASGTVGAGTTAVTPTLVGGTYVVSVGNGSAALKTQL